MKKFFNSQFWLVIVSIFLSLLLFLAATTSNYTHVGSQVSGATETYTHTLTNVPIDIKYDSDKYFISGYSYETEVYLTSINRVKLDSEINNDTRSFKVVADLTGLGEGTQTVPLKVMNLPSGVTATASPNNISVTIGKKKTKTFNVQGKVDVSQLAPGFELKKVSTDVSEVEVTSDESIIDQIDHVVANLPENEVLNGNYSGRVALQAVSADGTILASAINPSKARLEVSVKKLTKTVPVRVKLTGKMNDKVSDISYNLNQDQVTISGSQAALDAVNEVVATVNVSNITKDTSLSVNLAADNVSVEPSVVTVQLTATKK
ncbi:MULTISPECIES: CdaR family protein [Streptococcus]|uniref:YbbR domain-containing protein n=2 Tax=Streptococcus TaxID=1301 RepID=A0A1G9K5W7_STREI|nr:MULTISPECIES: CdaR family protein [Streptococcus]MBE6162681.1 YbbR-like domain-containing protein [Streptococcus equinus]QGX47243.1 YbbR-like domain-containing protein [Streptococcus equinus]SDL45079.1 YbbR domain-containing protein [Streptococcus equinus]SDQ05102.1 YbbR domain-containing protein [Streptococcus equinus]SEK26531.1 YbbR domain-containing protein [Streptococcus equinus]